MENDIDYLLRIIANLQVQRNTALDTCAALQAKLAKLTAPKPEAKQSLAQEDHRANNR